MTDLSHIGDTLVEVRDLLVQIRETLHGIYDQGRCCEAAAVGPQEGPGQVSLRCGLPYGHQGVHRTGAWSWDPA